MSNLTYVATWHLYHTDITNHLCQSSLTDLEEKLYFTLDLCLYLQSLYALAAIFVCCYVTLSNVFQLMRIKI